VITLATKANAPTAIPKIALFKRMMLSLFRE